MLSRSGGSLARFRWSRTGRIEQERNAAEEFLAAAEEAELVLDWANRRNRTAKWSLGEEDELSTSNGRKA
jgi:hypothetical protein